MDRHILAIQPQTQIIYISKSKFCDKHYNIPVHWISVVQKYRVIRNHILSLLIYPTVLEVDFYADKFLSLSGIRTHAVVTPMAPSPALVPAP